MLKKVVKIVLRVIVLLGVLATVIFVSKYESPKFKQGKIDEKLFETLQSKEAQITEFFTYGTSFNVSGKLPNVNKDNFEGAKLFITDGKDYESTYKLNSEIIDENLFFSSNEINSGLILDELENKECYYLFLRLSLNNSVEPRYYTFVNSSEYKDIEYYTITKDNQNRKIDIKFLERTYKSETYNCLTISIEETELPENVYDIVIDAGHGGKDSGERKGSDTEADITLEYAELLKYSLEEKGLKVKLTRDSINTENYTYTNMYDMNGRITVAGETKAKYMMSFHINNGDNSLKGLEIYAPCKSDLKLAESIANKIKERSSIEFSNNKSFKKSDGVYVKNFTPNVIKEYENTANKKGYEPYPLTIDTPFSYTIREVGGIATNAYVDGRNKDYSSNRHRNSNQGIECYQIELGYIKTDLEIIKNEKEQYIQAITDAIFENRN